MSGKAHRMTKTGQSQTSDVFGYKWQRRSSYERPEFLSKARAWLISRYGDVTEQAWLRSETPPVVLDAGCGSGMAALEYFGPVLARIDYLGVDISKAVHEAKRRFAEAGAPGRFIQADMMDIPIPDASVDVVFAEGTMHHTSSTRDALAALTRKLKLGGTFMAYVYNRKGPIREFSDDAVRQKIADMSPDEAWSALMPLTRLGKVLGDLLGIPAGKIDVQRLFYWHVCKAYYDPEFTLEEMNHINFDWFAPRYAHRQSPDEVRTWCSELGLAISAMKVEPSGITVIACRDQV